MIDERDHDLVIKQSRITSIGLKVAKLRARQSVCALEPQKESPKFHVLFPRVRSFCLSRRRCPFSKVGIKFVLNAVD